MLVCPQCSTENPTNHNFCQKCGFSLVCRWALVIDKSQDEGEATIDRVDDSHSPPTPNLYLGARYQQIGAAIKILPNKTNLVKVLDSLPKQPSPLQELMKQQPVVADTLKLGQPPSSLPEWELWERGGISAEARPYLALQTLLSPHIPQLYDTWHRNDRTVLILELCEEYAPLYSQSQDCNHSSLEIVKWLEDLLKLWIYLEPWSMRSSLLEPDNIYINDNQQVYLQRLIPEPTDRPLFIHDLVKSWLEFLPNSRLREAIDRISQSEELTVNNLKIQLQQVNTEDTNILHRPIAVVGLGAAAATDSGKQRDHNEDYFSIETNFSNSQTPQESRTKCRGLYILCDGMGGHAAGEVASTMASEQLQAYWAENWHDTLPTAEEIEQAIIFTNQALFETNQTTAAAGNGRMGTTLVMVMIQDNQIAIAHVGDSRCYLLESSSSLVQITLDHEVGQREMLRGVEPEIAYGRPDSYQLTQAIGPRDESSIAPDIQFFSLREDTLILMASDGLTDRDLLEIHGEALLRPMLQRTVTLSAGVNQLVEFGNNYNGHDNITAIVILMQIIK